MECDVNVIGGILVSLTVMHLMHNIASDKLINAKPVSISILRTTVPLRQSCRLAL